MAKRKPDKRQLKLELMSVAELKEAQADEDKAGATTPASCGFCTAHVPATRVLHNLSIKADVCDNCAVRMKKQGWESYEY